MDQKDSKRVLLPVVILVVVALGVFALFYFSGPEENQSPPSGVQGDNGSAVGNFKECVEAGNAVMESYPRQCRSADGQLFVEDIGNELEKSNLVRLTFPRPGETIESPTAITGEARGFWYFEATFPVTVTDWDGKIIGEGFATAQIDPADPDGVGWMTENFVPFTATLSFDVSQISGNYSNRGTLILQRSNASGLPEHDDALEIPVILK